MNAAKAVYPHEKYENQKHVEFISYCFRMRSELDHAEAEERRGNPFAMLKLDADARPDEISIMQYKKYYKEKHENEQQ